MSKTIVITGAAGAIGLATAEVLSKQGYQLVLVDKAPEKIHSLSQRLPNIYPIEADVTDACRMSEILGQFQNTLYGLVLAAGIEGAIGSIEDIHDEQFAEVMNINVTGVWIGIRYGLKILKPKKKGVIIALGSTSGLLPAFKLAPYCASKHAVLGLIKTAAREAAPFGIRVNAVCPGPVESPMMESIELSLLEQDPFYFKGNENAAKSIPMQRYAKPEEIANAIAFLCSEKNKYYIGMSMIVDGGLTCR